MEPHVSHQVQYSVSATFRCVLLIGTILLVSSWTTPLMADGSEATGIGTPSIPIAAGSGIVAAGTGLINGPGTIDIFVPGNVAQAILYWNGEGTPAGDDTVTVDGISVTGDLIGGPTFFFNFNGAVYSTTYRADITAMGLVDAGANSLTIEDLNAGTFDNGAGLLVIYDNGTTANIEINDGQDLAFIFFAAPIDAVVPQTFSYPASTFDRSADLTMFFASVGGAPGPRRPNRVVIDVDGGALPPLDDPLGGFDGEEWDTLVVTVNIPAGSTELTVDAISWDDGTSDLPASLTWIVAGLTVFETTPGSCRMTGGGVDGTVPPHAWAEGVDKNNHYTFGGQAGAPTGSQPQPFGEWTHRQHRGDDGRFTFHAGTASAPDGTEIDWIGCSDPINCNQARPAPFKQLDFEGVGSFKNLSGGSPVAKDWGAKKGVTLHWFEVHIEDLGEPGNADSDLVNTDLCPAEGHAGLPDGQEKCDCPDYYHIRIYQTPNPASPLIYEVRGYLNGGNFQIHPSIGG